MKASLITGIFVSDVMVFQFHFILRFYKHS